MSYYDPFLKWIFFSILLFFLLFPYLKAEVLSFLHPSIKSEANSYCSEIFGKPKYIKVIDMIPVESTVLCVYDDNSKNQLVKFLKTDKGIWSINFNRKVDKVNQLFWPVYF
jgi:hypothetical protein